jgi:hypothetical protein
MFFQTDPGVPRDFHDYACLFSDCLAARPALGGADWSTDEAVAAWKLARSHGIISGDLNGDGDYDDPGEDEIQRYQDLFDAFRIPLRVIDPASLGHPMGPDRAGVMRILPTSKPLDLSRYWVIEGWRWKKLHFVVGDGTGRRPVRYDSIKGGSLTVANGAAESLRVFEITAPRRA